LSVAALTSGLLRTAVALLATLSTACSAFVDYPDEARGAVVLFEGGDYEGAAQYFEDQFGDRSSDRFLGLAEAGMLRHMAGDLTGSTETWIRAEQELDSYDDRPTVSGRGLSEAALSLILNDKTLPYDGEGFEAALLHGFMAWDFLRMGDLNGAMVEVKRGYQVQTLEEARYDKTYGMNRFARFVAALAQEIDGAPDEAQIDLRTLAEELPGNVSVAYSLAKMEALQSPGRNQAAGRAEIVLIFERGRMPMKVAHEFHYGTNRSIGTFSVPGFGQRSLEPVAVEVFLNGETLGRTELLEAVAGVADQNLDDRIALLVAKAAIRSAAKTIAVDAGAKAVEEKHGEGWGAVAGILGSIFVGWTERADLRSWLTLPQEIQVLRVEVPPGRHHLRLRATGSDEFDAGIIEFQAGRPVLIGARSLRGRLLVALPEGVRVEEPATPETAANLNE
jgi:hypothetical protein